MSPRQQPQKVPSEAELDDFEGRKRGETARARADNRSPAERRRAAEKPSASHSGGCVLTIVVIALGVSLMLWAIYV